MPVPITELASLQRLKLLRVGSKQFAPLLLPPGFANLAAKLSELVLECADWPAIPQVTHTFQSNPILSQTALIHANAPFLNHRLPAGCFGRRDCSVLFVMGVSVKVRSCQLSRT